MRILQTGLLTAIVLAGWVVGPALAETPLSGKPLRQRLSDNVRFSCADTPFHKAIFDLGEANRVAVFVDRRVDPSREIALTHDKSNLWSVFNAIAGKADAECAFLGNTVYVAPAGSASVAAMVASLRGADVKRLPEATRRRLLRPVTLSWDALTTPDDLLRDWEAKTGIDTSAIREEIPHDLWPKGTLPTMAPTDSLTLLLIGFDRTFRFSDDGKRVFLTEIPSEDLLRRSASHSEVASALNPVTKSANPGVQPSGTDRKDPFARERFTLAVREKPLSAVLSQLARQLHLDVHWPDVSPDEKAARDRIRCSFSVKKADLDALLTAMFADTAYTFSRTGTRVEVRRR